MELKLYRGTRLLDINGIYHQGRLYIPGAALASYVGVWRDAVIFVNSPLAGKRICVTVLGPGTFKEGLPPAVEQFLSLSSAAGAQIIYYDGGKIPAGDLIIALEVGGTAPNVSYLGAPFRSKPLAKKIVTSLKRGLKLTYLPDPMAFPKSQYNIKLSLAARLCTPAVAVQLPSGLDELGSWLFTSLMEYVGHGPEMDADLFVQAHNPNPSPPMPELDLQVSRPSPSPGTPQPEPQAQKTMARALAKEQPTAKPILGIPGTASSASMSRAQYPEFFAQLDQRRKAPIRKEPFT